MCLEEKKRGRARHKNPRSLVRSSPPIFPRLRERDRQPERDRECVCRTSAPLPVPSPPGRDGTVRERVSAGCDCTGASFARAYAAGISKQPGRRRRDRRFSGEPDRERARPRNASALGSRGIHRGTSVSGETPSASRSCPSRRASATKLRRR